MSRTLIALSFACFLVYVNATGESCVGLWGGQGKDGVCAPLGFCNGTQLQALNPINTCPDVSEACCPMDGSNILDPSYSNSFLSRILFSLDGACAGVGQIGGTCSTGVTCPANNPAPNGAEPVIASCPLGSVCCGGISGTGKS